jgi:hypothetical protein
MTAAAPAENSEEEVETTTGLIGFRTENYLAKQRYERASLCLQVYMWSWFVITMYVVWLLIPSFP